MGISQAESGGVGALLVRALLLIATLAVALANGFGLTPVFDGVDYMLGIALRGYPFLSRSVINAYVTPAAIAVMTLAIAGIPAAVYERLRGLQRSTVVSLGIWFGAAVLLALPALTDALLSTDELR